MRLRLLWRVLYALASVSSSYRQKIAFENEGEPAAKGSICIELLTPTKFPALFILVWQVVMELIVQ